MSQRSLQVGTWSQWAWNESEQRFERFCYSRDGSVRTQYGQTAPPNVAPRYPSHPQLYVPGNPSYTSSAGNYVHTQQSGIQRPQQYSSYPAPAPAPVTTPTASLVAPPFFSSYSQSYEQQRQDSSNSHPYENFGSNNQSQDIYGAEGTSPNAQFDSSQPAQTVIRDSREDGYDGGAQSRASYEPGAQMLDAWNPAPVLVSQPSHVGASEFLPHDTPDDPSHDNYVRSPTDDTVDGFDKMNISETGGLSRSRYPSAGSKSENENLRNQAQKESKRPMSKSSYSRPSEERKSSRNSTLALTRITNDRPRQDSSSQVIRRDPDGSSKPSEKEKTNKGRRNSIQWRGGKEPESSHRKTPRDSKPPQDQRLVRMSNPDSQPRGGPELPSQRDKLDENYKVHPSREFSKGKVLMTLWTEPRGENSMETYENGVLVPSKFGQTAYHSIRRFVIFANKKGHSLCVPILTYGGSGTAKPGAKPEDHAIIYMAGTEETLVQDEKPLRKKAIKVAPRTPADKLAAASRINYAKCYTIEHNFLVHFIGKIHEDSEADFFTDYRRTNEVK